MTLSAKQARAIAALLDPACHTNQEAADKAGVPLRTLARWLAEDAAFRDALRAAQTATIEHAAMRLAALTEPAHLQLAYNLRPSVKPQHALRAAELVLSHAVKYHDLTALEARIAALEARDNDHSS